MFPAYLRLSLLASRRTYQDGAQDGAHASEEETPQHSPRARDDASQVGGEQQKRNREGQEKLCHVRVRGRRRLRMTPTLLRKRARRWRGGSRRRRARPIKLLVAPQAERRRAQDGGPHAPRIGGLDEGPGDGRESSPNARARTAPPRARRVAGRKAGCGAGCGAGDRRGDARGARARGRDDADAVPRDVSHRRAAVGQAKATARGIARRDATAPFARRVEARDANATRGTMSVTRATDVGIMLARAGVVADSRARRAARTAPESPVSSPRSRRSFACVGRRDESLFQKKASESACAANIPSTRRKPVSPL